MITFDPSIVTAIVSVVPLLVVIGGGVFWLGKLTNRVGQLENKIDRHSEEPCEIREEMRNLREELREEMRRGNQQLSLALANHSHGSDGQPVFRVTVSPE